MSPLFCPICFLFSKRAGDGSEAAAKIKAIERALQRGAGPEPGQGRFFPSSGGSTAKRESLAEQKRRAEETRHALVGQHDKVSAAQGRVRGARVPSHCLGREADGCVWGWESRWTEG
jgi:hypothetical protein